MYRLNLLLNFYMSFSFAQCLEILCVYSVAVQDSWIVNERLLSLLLVIDFYWLQNLMHPGSIYCCDFPENASLTYRIYSCSTFSIWHTVQIRFSYRLIEIRSILKVSLMVSPNCNLNRDVNLYVTFKVSLDYVTEVIYWSSFKTSA